MVKTVYIYSYIWLNRSPNLNRGAWLWMFPNCQLAVDLTAPITSAATKYHILPPLSQYWYAFLVEKSRSHYPRMKHSHLSHLGLPKDAMWAISLLMHKSHGNWDAPRSHQTSQCQFLVPHTFPAWYPTFVEQVCWAAYPLCRVPLLLLFHGELSSWSPCLTSWVDQHQAPKSVERGPSLSCQQPLCSPPAHRTYWAKQEHTKWRAWTWTGQWSSK